MSPCPSARGLAGWSVLLVLGDAHERTHLHGTLADAGFEVLDAGGAVEALEVLRGHPVQLVLVDAPVLADHGPDLVRALHEHGPDLHVIVLTAEGEQAGGAAVELADDAVRRPLDTAVLIRQLVGVVRRRVTEGAREVPPGALTEAALVEDIRRGLRAREFRVVYQPIVRVADRAVVGFEALVRWQHPVHGVLPPSAFIAAAERSGLIVDIGDSVLAAACDQAHHWLASGHDLHVAVNLSARQLGDHALAARIATVMAAASLPRGSLWLEVTETALIDDLDQARTTLRQIEAVGAWVSIDDFGTGWASLTYLRQLPSHALKIDRSFVAGLGTSQSDAAIVRSILLLGRDLGLTVIAEGVETEEQAAELSRLGCDLAQGFLFGRPEPADRLILPELRSPRPSPPPD